MNVAFDMETGDPDDYFSLVLLCCHPRVTIRCVTVTPGTKDQVSFVRAVLEKFQLKIPVGSRKPDHNKNCLSKFLSNLHPEHTTMSSDPDGLGCDVLYNTLKQYPDLVIITGAPLCNIGALLKNYDLKSEGITIRKIVCQGGFAGDNVVPDEDIIDKFRGKIYCSTYNFGGDRASAHAMLESDIIQERTLVSKNVCHSLQYDNRMHESVASRIQDLSDKNDESLDRFKYGLQLIYDGMNTYMQKRGSKMFHDPLACCAAIDSSVCDFAQVTMLEKSNQWGCERTNDGSTFISIRLHYDKFVATFLDV
jgi:inosine-uridine nucleoside N-ribohydrolase